MTEKEFELGILKNMPIGFRAEAKKMRDQRERIVRNTRDPKALISKMHRWQSRFLSMREVLESVICPQGPEFEQLAKIAVEALEELLDETAKTIAMVRRHRISKV